MQTIESWRESQTGLNPVQAGMQIAIPEIDGATEPFVYGGLQCGESNRWRSRIALKDSRAACAAGTVYAPLRVIN